ncbi:cytochrom P450 [Sparassis latifolia]|uniref:Cytochrome P450 52A3-A n=1 Tax=Sparassis crispa TaxID=139825 RepID=A0A401GYA5_9APHY|nr:Cytochrome P450 52A3-A [Sparassis crispa]GBE87187.1 Cytochrome P450 52A3-A [Sparassis crispa]
MSFPPGLAYLFRNLPNLLLPPAVVLVANLAVREMYGLIVPIWLFTLACIFSFPLALFVVVQWTDYVDRRDAAAHGAVLPPIVKAKLIAGLDILLEQKRTFQRKLIADMLFDFSETYGNIFIRRVFYENKVFTSEPEHIKIVLATHFPGFEKGQSFRGQMQSLLGTGVFNSDGEMWKFHRAMTRPFFSRDRIRHFEIFDRHVDDAFKQMRARLSEGYAVDWQDLVSRFTMDSATEFLFGQDVRSLSAGLPYPPTSPLSQQRAHPSDRFSRSFFGAQLQSALRSRFLGIWPLFEFWEDQVKKHVVAIDDFIKPVLENALREKDQKKDQGVDDTTLLEHLVNLTDDSQIIQDEILNILLAGRDTTAATLTFAVYKLAQHPHILRRLRQEVLAEVGTSRRPTHDDIREMKFLRAFINETLRLYPPVPFNFRSTIKGTVLPSMIPGEKPYFLPANTRFQYSVFVMHRRKDLWGPDALEFDPDRFLDQRLHKYLTPNPYIFLPFNAGPRICLGQQFAYNEVSFMLVRLLQQFVGVKLALEASPGSLPPPGFVDSRGSNGEDEVLFTTHLTMYVKDGLWLRMDDATAC